jgi:hypothetical protein
MVPAVFEHISLNADEQGALSSLIEEEHDFQNKASPFLMGVRKEGIVIWLRE